MSASAFAWARETISEKVIHVEVDADEPVAHSDPVETDDTELLLGVTALSAAAQPIGAVSDIPAAKPLRELSPDEGGMFISSPTYAINALCQLEVAAISPVPVAMRLMAMALG